MATRSPGCSVALTGISVPGEYPEKPPQGWLSLLPVLRACCHKACAASVAPIQQKATSRWLLLDPSTHTGTGWIIRSVELFFFWWNRSGLHA